MLSTTPVRLLALAAILAAAPSLAADVTSTWDATAFQPLVITRRPE